jgi:hypothetical protein
VSQKWSKDTLDKRLRPSPHQRSPADFEPAELVGYGVSVLFKPTQARYVFKVINGILQRGRTVDRRNADLGGYDGSQCFIVILNRPGSCGAWRFQDLPVRLQCAPHRSRLAAAVKQKGRP